MGGKEIIFSVQGWSLEDDEEEDDLLKPETSGASAGKEALVPFIQVLPPTFRPGQYQIIYDVS